MNKDKVIELAKACAIRVESGYSDVYAFNYNALCDFAAALTEPLEKEIAKRDYFIELKDGAIAAMEKRIAELEAAAKVKKIPMTAKELIVLLEKHHGYGSAWAAFARDVERHHGIGVKV